MADDRKGWFEWLPWRGKDSSSDVISDPATFLGMEPLTAVLVLAGIVFAGLTLYYNPRQFWRGFAHGLGEVTAVIVSIIVGAVVVVGGAVLYFDLAGVSVIVLLAAICVIVVIAFLGLGGG